MSDFFNFGLWVAGTSASAWACWRLTGWFQWSFLERLAGAHVLWLWWITTLTISLGLLSLLTLPLTAGLSMGVAAAVFVARPQKAVGVPSIDWQNLLRQGQSWALLMALGFWTLSLLHAAAAPPRAWDTLTYHLPRAAFWVQQMSFAPQNFEGAWKYYEYFGPVGDLLWAWTFLAGQGDGLLFLGLGYCASLLTLSIFVFADVIGAAPSQKLLGAAVALLIPAAARYAPTAYVDNLQAGLLLLALSAAKKSWHKDESGIWTALAATAAALAASNKFSGLPLLLLVGFYLALNLTLKKKSIYSWALVLLALTPWTEWSLHTYLKTGSLTYPFELLDGRYHLFAGNTELKELMAGARFKLSSTITFTQIYDIIASPLNFSMSMLILLPACITGVMAWKRDRPLAWFALVAAFVFLPLVAILLPANLALRTVWFFVAGRHLLVPAILYVLAASSLPSRLTKFSLWGVFTFLLITNVLNINIGWKPLDYIYTLQVCAPLLLAGFTIILGYVLGWLNQFSAPCLAMLTVAALWSMQPLRLSVRNDFYKIAREQGSYDLHPVFFGEQDLLWKKLDQSRPLTIALATGNAYQGHNWFIYPYLGSRLQNRVRYVVPPRSIEAQSLIFPAGTAPGISNNYLSNLTSAGCNFVAIIAPYPTELKLIQHLSFPLVYLSPNETAALFSLPR